MNSSGQATGLGHQQPGPSGGDDDPKTSRAGSQSGAQVEPMWTPGETKERRLTYQTYQTYQTASGFEYFEYLIRCKML